MIKYERDLTNHTIGTLIYTEEGKKSIRVNIGFPADRRIETLQRLLNEAFKNLDGKILMSRITK